MSDQEHPWESEERVIRAAFNSLQGRVERTKNELMTHQDIPKSVFDKLEYEENRIKEVRDKLLANHKA